MKSFQTWWEESKQDRKMNAEEMAVMDRAANVVMQAQAAAKQARRQGDDDEDDRQSERASKVRTAMENWFNFRENSATFFETVKQMTA